MAEKKNQWIRNDIDRIVTYRGRMRVTLDDGEVLTGKCIGDCLGTDDDGEDVDGARFLPDGGEEIDLIEADIKGVEFLDGPPLG